MTRAAIPAKSWVYEIEGLASTVQSVDFCM